MIMTPSAPNRRNFLKQSLALSALSAAPAAAGVKREPGTRMRLALNAYSFDKPLRDGSMTLFDVIEQHSQHLVQLNRLIQLREH